MEQYYESAAEWNFEWKLGYAVNGERIPLVIQKISDSSYALCMDHWNNGPKPNPAQEKSVQRRNSVGNPDELPIFLIYYIDKFNIVHIAQKLLTSTHSSQNSQIGDR